MLVAVGAAVIPAQTKFKLDRNKYTLEQDVKVGQEAAAQVSKELRGRGVDSDSD